MSGTTIQSHDKPVQIQCNDTQLEGILGYPDHPRGMVLFAHESGSSRRSPRNTVVAQMLQQLGFATLLFDLLTEEEAANRLHRFEIPFLAERLQGAREWIDHYVGKPAMPYGYVGASTGAAAALQAAAIFPEHVQAVVSRGGRPDLAQPHLSQVNAPTLLIVGGKDDLVLKLNQAAFSRLTCPKDLVVIPGASHLFEEPGTMDEVAQWTLKWFSHYLK